MTADDSSTAADPRRVYVMYRKAWWRLTVEEWWEFLSAQFATGSAPFPNVNLIGQPRAVLRIDRDGGPARYEPRTAGVWVQVIDDWSDDEWDRAAAQVLAIGMTDPRRDMVPWPSGVAPKSVPTPVYGLEAYTGDAPVTDAERDRDG